MCFGEKLSEEQVKDIEVIQRRLISFSLSIALNLCPTSSSKIIFFKRWKNLIQLCIDQENLLIHLIRARLKSKQTGDSESVVAYVDTLMNLQLPEENNRMLEEWEIVSLCSEFLTAGTDTTSTALQWIMANLVKYPKIQAKLYDEAVVLEGLRRHPPSHFVVPHKLTEEVELNGYVIPTNAVVNFMVAEIGYDQTVW